MTRLKPMIWDLSLAGFIFVTGLSAALWFFSTMASNADIDVREKRILSLVDEKYSTLNQKVDEQGKVLQRMDDRIYKIYTRSK